MENAKRILKFSVTNQSITKDSKCDFSKIAMGTSGYLVAQFEFSNDWDNISLYKKQKLFSPHNFRTHHMFFVWGEKSISSHGTTHVRSIFTNTTSRSIIINAYFDNRCSDTWLCLMSFHRSAQLSGMMSE